MTYSFFCLPSWSSPTASKQGLRSCYSYVDLVGTTHVYELKNEWSDQIDDDGDRPVARSSSFNTTRGLYYDTKFLWLAGEQRAKGRTFSVVQKNCLHLRRSLSQTERTEIPESVVVIGPRVSYGLRVHTLGCVTS